jgi:hypothetical protein
MGGASLDAVGAAPTDGQVLEQVKFDVRRRLDSPNDARPQLERRLLDQFIREANSIQIVMQILAPTAVTSVAGHSDPRAAITPVASSSYVLRRFVGEKHIGALVPALGPSLEPATSRGQRGEISFIVDAHQDIDVFRIGFLGEKRTDQCDASNSWQ